MTRPTLPESQSTSRPRLGAATALLAFCAGCSAEATIPRIVISQAGVEVSGVPNPNQVVTTTTARFDHPAGFEVPKVLEAKLFPLGVTISTLDSAIDLGFVEEFTLTLGSLSDEALPPRQLASFEGGARRDGDNQFSLEIPTNESFNVVPYWASGDAYYELTARGIVPESDWSLDVTAQFSGALTW